MLFKDMLSPRVFVCLRFKGTAAYFILEFLLGSVFSLCFSFELFNLCDLLLPHFGERWVRNTEKWKLFQHQGQKAVFIHFHCETMRDAATLKGLLRPHPHLPMKPS